VDVLRTVLGGAVAALGPAGGGPETHDRSSPAGTWNQARTWEST
jgi:hypothetical protein